MLIRSIAPLRLGLAGGGTDVSPYCDIYGGTVLNSTIDMYAYCTIEPLDSNEVVFDAVDLEIEYRSECNRKLEIDETLKLHKGVYNRIVAEFNNNQPLSFRMTTYSDSPPGSGLGSSSTLVVAMITCFTEWLGLPLGEYDIAQLAFEIERRDVGMVGGKQDQYAATFGGFNYMEFFRDDRVIVNPLRIKNWILHELDSSMILYYTGVSRVSAKIIDEQIENVNSDEATAIAAMHKLKEDAVLMKKAILNGDIVKYAHLLGDSWLAKKKTASSISNDMIDEAYSVALDSGAYSGKISGAGGGGFMILVVDPKKKVQVSKNLEHLPGRVMNFHFTNNGARGWIVR